jgi:23S rRNA (uracil1939-C5)-methyltransferase
MKEGRVTCPHAPKCPGCPLIRLPYEAQAAVKRDRVLEVVARFPVLAGSSVRDTVRAASPTGYRARAKLAAADGRIGLFSQGSHAVVDVPECRVLEPVVLCAVNAVRTAAADLAAAGLGVPLRAVDARSVDDGVLLTLVVPDGTDEVRVRNLADRVVGIEPSVTGVALGFRDEDSRQVLGRAPRPLLGAARATCHVRPRGPFHYATHGAFTQANRSQQAALFDGILGALEARLGSVRGLSVLELFAGSGALSVELAARGARVTAVEVFEPAARLAGEAAEAQNLDIAVRVEDAARATSTAVAERRAFDVVVANPPRRGLVPSIREDLAALSPKLVVYVSCEPRTLVRDLADIRYRGFLPVLLAPYDMMPLTEEVETLAVLAPAPVPPPEVLYADAELIAVEKPPHEPTTPQGEHASSLLARVRRLDGAENAVPVHRLDASTSGVCLFARRPEHVAALSSALSAGEKEYVALARGITRDKGSIRRPLPDHGRARDARTRYARRQVVGGHSLLTVRPDEGRKHQIRRHLASIGHPVVGDARYGDPRTNQHFAALHGLDRTFLHCSRIRIEHCSRALELEAKLAPDLGIVLDHLPDRR